MAILSSRTGIHGRAIHVQNWKSKPGLVESQNWKQKAGTHLVPALEEGTNATVLNGQIDRFNLNADFTAAVMSDSAGSVELDRLCRIGREDFKHERLSAGKLLAVRFVVGRGLRPDTLNDRVPCSGVTE